MQERRRFVRVPEESPISYEVLNDARTGQAFTKDISQGGIRFFVKEFIPKDSLLKIYLPLQKILFNFETVIKIVWITEAIHSERYEVGAEFVNISEEDTERLVEYIEKYIHKKIF